MRSILVLLSLALAPLAFAPVATAHVCSASDPATMCGSCGTGGSHDHRYSNGSPYCSSGGSDPTYVCVDVNGQKEVCVTIESIAALDLPGRDVRFIELDAPAPYAIRAVA